jgi:beta-glucanase (GH16 family)
MLHGQCRSVLCFPLLLSILVVASQLGCAQTETTEGFAATSGWVPTWSDEFDGPDGSAPDAAKWIVESGGSGWGNNELQYYTARRANVRQEGGKLVIDAVREDFAGPEGVQHQYTSGRVKTEGRFSQQYGRFEARIQVPGSAGLWPAFWLLGSDFSTAGWPDCGEIDIMENVGMNPANIHGSLHGPGYSGKHSITAAYTISKERFSRTFHTFAVEWEPEVVRFFVDDGLFATRTPADLPAGRRWVFDHPFFILLNLAVGGEMPGRPPESTVFPQRLLVEYVRVYKRE